MCLLQFVIKHMDFRLQTQKLGNYGAWLKFEILVSIIFLHFLSDCNFFLVFLISYVISLLCSICNKYFGVFMLILVACVCFVASLIDLAMRNAARINEISKQLALKISCSIWRCSCFLISSCPINRTIESKTFQFKFQFGTTPNILLFLFCLVQAKLVT